MKQRKQADYEGQPVPELKEVLNEQIKQLMDQIIELLRQFPGTDWLPGLAT